MSEYIFATPLLNVRGIKFFHHLLDEYEIPDDNWETSDDLDTLIEKNFPVGEGNYSRPFIETFKETMHSFFDYRTDAIYFYVEFDSSFYSEAGTEEDFADEAESMLKFDFYRLNEEEIRNFSDDEEEAHENYSASKIDEFYDENVKDDFALET